MIFPTLILLAAIAFLGWTRIHSVAAYFQQEEYDNARFLRAWPGLSVIDFKFSIAAVLIIVVTSLLTWPTLALVAAAGAALAIAVLECRAARSMKKPLSKTARATRLMVLTAVIWGFAAAMLVIALGLIGAIVAMQIIPLVMIVANLLRQPLQQRENQRYIDQARAKLATYGGTKIAITGSFGKTTVKHCLGDALGQLSTVFYSTGSINTVLGLTRHIRERLQPAHRYFIAEMGAYGLGSIQRLCALVDPDVAIITSIGLAHNERFGGLETVAQAKSELAAWVVAKGGKVVMTQDVARYEPFAAIVRSHPDLCILVGEEASAAPNYHIQSPASGPNGTSLTLADQKTGNAMAVELPLLGAHNSDNLALMAALLLTLGWTQGAVATSLGAVRHVPHRLAPRAGPNGATILDDAYNANPVGMKNAIQLAAEMAAQQGGKAYAITPGLVELGDRHDDVHEKIGTLAGKALAKTIIVTPERVRSLEAGIRSSGGIAQTATSYLQARAMLDPELQAGDVLLIANDLPDLLGSRVWL